MCEETINPRKGRIGRLQQEDTSSYHPPGDAYYLKTFDVTCSMQPS